MRRSSLFRVKVDYGRSGLEIEVPSSNLLGVLDISNVRPLARQEEAVRNALFEPIASEPLSVLAAGRKSAVIVISDITRPVPNGIIVPPLVDSLEAAGIRREEILIIVGNGLHRPCTRSEIEEMLGGEVPAGLSILQNEARDDESHISVGKTSSGTPVRIHKAYLEADFRIVTGLIEPHAMAGFSGGLKGICPGIAGSETIKGFHSPELLFHPNAREGILEGNPLQEFLDEVRALVPVEFLLNVVIESKRNIAAVFSGNPKAAHRKGCAFAASMATARFDRQADVVITSAAGYPLDATFYQAIKGITAAEPAVKEGGIIIIAAECAEGLGSPDFTGLVERTKSLETFLDELARPDYFVVDQWQLQLLARLAGKVEIYLICSGLPPDSLSHLGIRVFGNAGSAIEEALAEKGTSASFLVVPRGPYVIPRREVTRT